VITVRYHAYEGPACGYGSGEVIAAELAGTGKESAGDADAEQVGALLLETVQCPAAGVLTELDLVDAVVATDHREADD